MTAPPCLNCPDRRIGCHDPAVCPRWAAYDAIHRAELAAVPSRKEWVDGSDGAMAMEIVASSPAADVAPVVHGRWDDSGRYTFPSGSTAVRCTNCGCALTESEYHLNNWNYCPVCGAKMDGGADHEAD